MDSINKNQPEENRKDLRGAEAVQRLQKMVADAPNCFFCTTNGGQVRAGRPMNVRQVDDAGNFWFFSASDSHKNQQLALDPAVELYFQGSTHSDFLQVSGRATVSADPAKIRELWAPLLKTWFTGGVDDPRITVVRVAPTGGYYWDTKHGNTVAGIKMLIGAAIGKTLDDSIEGELTV